MVIEKRYRVEIGEVERVTVFLVGCGGTGSFVALHLARLAYAARDRLDLRLVFIDPDYVEAKNIGRQNFCPAEIGQAKAEALARRYSFAFGLDIRYVVAPFSARYLSDYAPFYDSRGLTLLVGCVDSAAARQDIHKAAWRETQRDIWWLDAGNDFQTGQVLLGNAPVEKPMLSPLGYCTQLPYPAWQEPGLIETPEPVPPGENLSCAELMLMDAQSLMINQAMADWVSVYLYRLVLSRDLDIYATYLNQVAGSVRSLPITAGRAEVEALPDLKPDRATAPAGMAAELEEAFVCPHCRQALIEGMDTVVEGEEPVPILFCECGWWITEAQHEELTEAGVLVP